MEKSETPAEILPFDRPEPEVFEPISDSDLAKGGMEKTTAWVRSETSRAALRQAKHRKKQEAKIAEMAEASGEADLVQTVQANLGQLPEPVAKQLRSVAKAVRAGATMSEAVATLPGVAPIAVKEIARLVHQPVPDPDTIRAVQQLQDSVRAAVRIGGPFLFSAGFLSGIAAAWLWS